MEDGLHCLRDCHASYTVWNIMDFASQPGFLDGNVFSWIQAWSARGMSGVFLLLYGGLGDGIIMLS